MPPSVYGWLATSRDMTDTTAYLRWEAEQEREAAAKRANQPKG